MFYVHSNVYFQTNILISTFTPKIGRNFFPLDSRPRSSAEMFVMKVNQVLRVVQKEWNPYLWVTACVKLGTASIVTLCRPVSVAKA